MERERGALRIHALRDAVAARHFHRAHHHLAVTLLHPPERGAFGVPTFFVGNEMYFGKDRLRDVEEELARQAA